MNDHNLDDLIIDSIAPKNNKTKSLLTIVALLIIVLIVAIILTKTLLKSPKTGELRFEENVSEMIAPELQLQAQEEVKMTEVSKPKEELSLTHIIEEKITLHESLEEAKEPEAVEEANQPIEIQKKEEPAHPPKEIKPNIDKVGKKPLLDTVSKPNVVTSKPQPKQVTKKEIKKPLLKPTNRAPLESKTGKYYVQVSSFKSATPGSRLLSVIKSSGFRSQISAPDATGYKKLLIGPYKTRAEVDKARDIVRDRILKSAFVVER